jgi:multiple sugar transport system permease protein
MVFAPFLVSPIASAVLWQWLLDPHYGAVNRLFGLSTNWFAEATPAQIAVVAVTGWSFMGFALLIVSAGLAGINDDYAAAAELDGASRWQVTRWITLPLLSPTLVFLTLLTVLLSSQLTFPLIDALTQGGPGTATTNIYYLLWEYGFQTFNAGLGAAAGVIYFVGFGVVALVLIWLSERLSFHDN